MALSPGWAALPLTLGIAAIFFGCGGSDGAAPATTAGSVDADAHRSAPRIDRDRYVERAEAICSRSLRETRTLSRDLPEVIAGSASPQEGITNGLVRPGIGILSREAAELRDIEPVPSSRALKLYLGLFDPIVELSRQRLQVGTAGEPERARNLELMIAELGSEQSVAARRFGLRACAVPFTRALGGPGQ
jgi:hypothetical protein